MSQPTDPRSSARPIRPDTTGEVRAEVAQTQAAVERAASMLPPMLEHLQKLVVESNQSSRALKYEARRARMRSYQALRKALGDTQETTIPEEMSVEMPLPIAPAYSDNDDEIPTNPGTPSSLVKKPGT